MAFVSSPSITNEVNTAYGVSTANTKVSPNSIQVNTGSQIPNNSRKGVGFVSYNAVPPPPTGLFSPPKLNLSNSSLEEFQQPKFEGYVPMTSKSVSKDIPNEVKDSPDDPLVNESQCPKGNQRNWNNQKSQQLGSDFVCGSFVCGSFDHLQANLPSTIRRPIQKKTTLTNRSLHKKVNTARPKVVNTGRPKAVITAIPSLAVVNVVSGCSRHITSKGTLKTGKLDFKDVYFVKELKFHLLSVSQMCDKKNSVLFTDTGYFVLSSDFKLADKSQVLLKVLRKNNMYNVDMKNIDPKEKTKDETSGILKRFITEIENIVDKKVKVISCDNGTKFENSVMNYFCSMKGIRREFSVARTPQQNGVAKRRNRTII
nr:putative ribonuclease H-like domain-containing protein [Tanacetum cinerariifolium]